MALHERYGAAGLFSHWSFAWHTMIDFFPLHMCLFSPVWTGRRIGVVSFSHLLILASALFYKSTYSGYGNAYEDGEMQKVGRRNMLDLYIA